MNPMRSNNARSWSSRFFPKLLLPLLLAGLVELPALPAGAADDAPAQANFKALSKQGIHYYKKKLWVPAISTLEQAAATTEGGKDYKTHYYLAKATEETLQLEKAFPYARKAVELAKTEEDQDEAKKLMDTLEKYYAGVLFEQNPDQPEKFEKGGIIILKSTKPIINQQKKKVCDKIAEYFKAKPVQLPSTIYLPFGEYEANGAPFTIEQGKEAKAKVFLYNPNQSSTSMWWIVGGGVAAAGLTAGILLPILLSEDIQTAKVGKIQLGPASEP